MASPLTLLCNFSSISIQKLKRPELRFIALAAVFDYNFFRPILAVMSDQLQEVNQIKKMEKESNPTANPCLEETRIHTSF